MNIFCYIIYFYAFGEMEKEYNSISTNSDVVNHSSHQWFVFIVASVVFKRKLLAIFSICFIWKFDLI